MVPEQFYEQGWCVFPYDEKIEAWRQAALPLAQQAAHHPDNAVWLRCSGTWFVGVNALKNDRFGTVKTHDGSDVPLHGKVIEVINHLQGLGTYDWDKAQVSICYPSYPQPSAAESDKAFRFRKSKDAAHIDGLHPEGPRRRRHLRETHGFILGIPMVEFSTDASPFVVWDRSHELIRNSLEDLYRNHSVDCWGDLDITEQYQSFRQNAFDQCQRLEIHAKPGEAFLVHRFALHGMAPWGADATAEENGRMICYFRPQLDQPERWLSAQ